LEESPVPSLEEQIAQLEAAMAAQEALRPSLGDEAVEAVIAALRAEREALRPRESPPAQADSLEALIAAGDAAAHSHAFAEAEACYARAVELLAQLPDDDAHRRRVEVTVKRLGASIHAEGFHHHFAPLAETESLLRRLSGGDQLRLARVFYWMGRAHEYLNETRLALAYYRQTLPVARALNDEELVGIPSGALGQQQAWQGRLDQAEPLLRDALSSLEKNGHWSHWVSASAALAVTLAGRGRYREGLAEAERALARAREWNNPAGVVQSHLASAAVYHLGGEAERCAGASRAAVEAAQSSRDQAQLYLAHLYLAWAESASGRGGSAEAHLAQAHSTLERFGGRWLGVEIVPAFGALIALNGGRADEALQLAERAVIEAQHARNLFVEGLAHQAAGVALTHLKQPGEAERRLNDSLRLLESGDNRLEAAQTHLALGRLHRGQGAMERALEHLSKAMAQFGSSELTSGVRQVLSLMSG
jgi:tetratricopeptide (TPR) repeat protein